jgi:hypothetical protein
LIFGHVGSGKSALSASFKAKVTGSKTSAGSIVNASTFDQNLADYSPYEILELCSHKGKTQNQVYSKLFDWLSDGGWAKEIDEVRRPKELPYCMHVIPLLTNERNPSPSFQRSWMLL